MIQKARILFLSAFRLIMHDEDSMIAALDM